MTDSTLRDTAESFLRANEPRNAVFWAEQLGAHESAPWEDVRLYVRCLLANAEFSRALSVLRKLPRERQCADSRLLTAQALYGGERVEEAAATLNDVLCESSSLAARDCASAHLLLGRCYLVLENRGSAGTALQGALRLDPDSVAALELLVDERLFAPPVLRAFVEELLASLPQDHPLEETRRILYRAKVGLESVGSIPTSLSDSLALKCAEAERLFDECEYAASYRLIKAVLAKEEDYSGALGVLVAILVEMEKEDELFLLSHRLVDARPKESLSWYAVGAYYYLLGNFEAAKKFLVKAGGLGAGNGRCWLLLAHSFAAEQEHDQAISCYLKASKLLSGSHLPFLYIGIENCLSKNFILSFKFLDKALEMAPGDVGVLNELGTLHYREGYYDKARAYFLQAFGGLVRKAAGWAADAEVEVDSGLAAAAGGRGRLWEAVLSNLGVSLLKSGGAAERASAVRCLEAALDCRPREPTLLAQLGLALLCDEQLDAGLTRLQDAMSFPSNNLGVYKSLLSVGMEALTDPGRVSLEAADTPDFDAFHRETETLVLGDPPTLGPTGAAKQLPSASILSDVHAAERPSSAFKEGSSSIMEEEMNMSVSMG